MQKKSSGGTKMTELEELENWARENYDKVSEEDKELIRQLGIK